MMRKGSDRMEKTAFLQIHGRQPAGAGNAAPVVNCYFDKEIRSWR